MASLSLRLINYASNQIICESLLVYTTKWVSIQGGKLQGMAIASLRLISYASDQMICESLLVYTAKWVSIQGGEGVGVVWGWGITILPLCWYIWAFLGSRSTWDHNKRWFHQGSGTILGKCSQGYRAANLCNWLV